MLYHALQQSLCCWTHALCQSLQQQRQLVRGWPASQQDSTHVCINNQPSQHVASNSRCTCWKQHNKPQAVFHCNVNQTMWKWVHSIMSYSEHAQCQPDSSYWKCAISCISQSAASKDKVKRSQSTPGCSWATHLKPRGPGSLQLPDSVCKHHKGIYAIYGCVGVLLITPLIFFRGLLLSMPLTLHRHSRPKSALLQACATRSALKHITQCSQAL